MKLRTLDQVTTAIDDDLAWRKRELTTAKFLWEGAREKERDVALRAAAVLAYAHWEGFVKEAARVFLNFVQFQGLDYCDLQPGVIALTLRSQLKIAEDASRVAVHTSVVAFLVSDLKRAAEIPWDTACSDIGNMTFQAFEDIARMLGIDCSRYATKARLIDERLVRTRHLIAHGKRVPVTETEAAEIHGLAVSLIEDFRVDSENALALASYRR
ncbi:MAG: hypothetical protein HY873_10940 [Chloroflexi bacterium]|nr:hypothetical protein [Chloroflexota bacterium]